MITVAILVAFAARPEARRAAEAEGEVDALLRTAFARRYGCDTRMVLEITVRNRFGEVAQRRARAASKWIRDRLHALVRFESPPSLRDVALLSVENHGHPDDHFLYLPSLGKARRITMAQRADAFLGTDFAYEDLERRRVADYELSGVEVGRSGSEPVHVVNGRPRFDADYAGIQFLLAVSDGALLETRYFREETPAPFKVIESPRAAMRTHGSCTVPTYLVARNPGRGTRTELRVLELEMNPSLEDELFTVTALERKRKIMSAGR